MTTPLAVAHVLASGTVGAAAVAAAAQFLPMVTSIAPLRRRFLPRLAGISTRHHIALTFDDGPDRRSTPFFLDLLADRGVRATFFLLGAHAEREPELVREMSAAGHELAVHGWEHNCLALQTPGRLAEQLTRSREVIEDLSGTQVTWYRPPYGVMTGEGLRGGRLGQARDPGHHRDHGSALSPPRRNGASPRHGPDCVARILASHARSLRASPQPLGRTRRARRSPSRALVAPVP
jgi:peptidoglycan/xylan/chitin deacetylase (PgdA/CDA1 family)